MKKIVTFAAAFGLMASMGTAAFADADATTTTGETSTTVSGSSTTVVEATKLVDEPLIKPTDLNTIDTIPLVLTENTPFYFEPAGKMANMLAPQTVFSTGNRVTDIIGNGEWVEIYTWLGKAWVHVAPAM
ncbi:hypothetical protein P4H66_28400 [Paenibacillus dokdonensis]|uniref:SH3b domain-containing protein n=1 Tax=Paenibacillus dokdonensis TaxID=2567944 RepID=A0ABU6GWJ5_9BACL|nr:hypothetical protein [Paenibacillus dokdonensis]MEC0243734.1 hypothetical protein [Paenibacillus dokdonensis]